MKFRFVVGAVLVAMSSLLGFGQTSANNHDPSRAQAQSACEDKTLHDLRAREVVNGSAYTTLLDVATAFGLRDPPRLYFFAGGGNSYYIAGSLSLDGRGKILMAKKFVKLMGSGLAFKGVVAHETAHLAVDIHGDTSCDQWIMRDPKVEEAADALAATKVGFAPLTAFLLRVEKITGATSGETESRLQVLRKIDAQKNARR